MRSRIIKKEFKISENEFLILDTNYKASLYNKTDFIMMSVYNAPTIERNISNSFIFIFDENINSIKNRCRKYTDKEYIDNLYQCLNQINDLTNDFINYIHEKKLFFNKDILKNYKRLSFNINEYENKYIMEAVRYYNYKNQTDFIRSLISNNIYQQEIYYQILNSFSITADSISNIMNRLNYFSYLKQDEKNNFINYSYQIRNKLNRRSSSWQ